MSFRMLLLASAGGAIGACARYLVTTWFAARGLTHFPWATFLINVSGSFLMGVTMGFVLARADIPAELRIFLATGILGGYTTFSAFSLEIWQLAERGAVTEAGIYAIASVVVSLVALLAGLALARWMIT